MLPQKPARNSPLCGLRAQPPHLRWPLAGQLQVRRATRPSSGRLLRRVDARRHLRPCVFGRLGRRPFKHRASKSSPLQLQRSARGLPCAGRWCSCSLPRRAPKPIGCGAKPPVKAPSPPQSTPNRPFRSVKRPNPRCRDIFCPNAIALGGALMRLTTPSPEPMIPTCRCDSSALEHQT